MHGPSCPKAYGTFPDQESNLCSLKMDSLPLSYKRSPAVPILNFSVPIQLFLYYQPNKSIEYTSHLCNSWVIWNSFELLDRNLHGSLRNISPLPSLIVNIVYNSDWSELSPSWDSTSTISGLREKSSPDIPITLLGNKTYGFFKLLMSYLCLSLYFYIILRRERKWAS